MSSVPGGIFIPPAYRGTSLESVWYHAWEQFGDQPDLVSQAITENPDYDKVFAGNRRDDGSLILSDSDYRARTEAYDDILLSVNLAPGNFQGKYGDLISGLVSANEFASRVNSVYERVVDNAPAIRDYYATNFAEDFTDEAIIASMLDPDVGNAILTKQITMSEVGGEAASRGFQIATDFANQLVNAGMDSQSEAAEFFTQAENVLPVLQTLAIRHADADDDFDLNEFAQATIFGDPTQRRRMRTLQAQERSTFAENQQGIFARNREGLATGLIQR